MEVSHGGIVLAAVLVVLQVDADDGFLDLADVDVADEQVFEVAAAHGIGFEADRAVEVGAVHRAVFDEHVADAAAHFAAEHHAAVAVFHRAAADDDVLAGHADAAAVGVAARS